MNVSKSQIGGDHYKNMAIQPVMFIHANKIPHIEACIIEYVCRHKKKGGKQDLEKARHYIDYLIDLEYGKEESVCTVHGTARND